MVEIESKLKYHILADKQIITSAQSSQKSYTITARLEENTQAIISENNQAGRFILATNPSC
jgi:hypothetical protein